MDYIFRKELFGGILYDIKTDRIYYTDKKQSHKLNTLDFILLNQDEEILSQNYFKNKTGRIIENPSNCTLSVPITVFFEITKSCNLKCNHCFNDSMAEEELSLEEIKNIVDNMVNVGVLNIKITGGEPFCRDDIFSILDYLEEKNLNFTIFTNATLLTGEKVDKLKRYDRLQKIRVSIDGNKETNDSIRGKGSFDKAVESIELLSSKNVPFEINYTFTKNNYNQIEEVANYFKEKGINCNINIGTVKIAGRTKPNQEYYFIDDEIDTCISSIQNQISRCENILPFYILQPIYYKLYSDSFGCPAARLSLTIKNNGNVFACGLFSSYTKYCCGNVLKEDLLNIWQSEKMNYFRTLPENSKCTNCNHYKKTCTGACRGNALGIYEDILENDIHCNFYKSDFNLLRSKKR